MLKIYNTETREKEAIVPHVGDKIKMYTCGPTIYDFAHIGNFRTYVFEDLLRRSLKFFGFPVEQAMNITDVDDKTIRGAVAQGISLKEYTEPFKRAFFEDLKTLHIEPIEHYPEATAFIPQMIGFIEKLIEKGFAYTSKNGSVYFAIRKFSSYGRLSHFTLDTLQVNASGDNDADEYEKENLSDFVLWKAYDPSRDGQIYWDSPFGKGRPGWHLECSTMAMQILGATIDLHCGGVDNMFPHHENEIAQSESLSNQHFVHHWVHTEHLLVDGKKMSKSLGNFYTLRDLLDKGYKGREVRYLLLSVHYRTQLNFTIEGLKSARQSLERVQDLLQRLEEIDTDQKEAPDVKASIETADRAFRSALSDDLNISLALGALFDFVREVNTFADQGKIGIAQKGHILTQFQKWDQVLAVFSFEKEALPTELTALLEERSHARKEKNFQRSDEIRQILLDKGYLIEDTPKGARLKKIE